MNYKKGWEKEKLNTTIGRIRGHAINKDDKRLLELVDKVIADFNTLKIYNVKGAI